MRIICLVEDENRAYLKSEHGLSIYIDPNILFDMGQSNLFMENAEKLGVNIQKIGHAIISHGHYDHGGGLQHFLDNNKISTIYIGRGAFRGRYANDNSSWRYIGLESRLKNNPRIKYVDDNLKIMPGYDIMYKINDIFPMPSGNSKLFMDYNGKRIPDDFRDEIILVINHENILAVITGCSHKGILNIVESVNRRYSRPPDVIIGGFHLEGVDEAQSVVDKLGECDMKVYTGHCTSKEAYRILEEKIDIKALNTGTIIDLD